MASTPRNPASPLRDPVRAGALALLTLALLASFRQAPFPQQMALQHLPTVLAILLLGTASHRLPLGRAGFLWLTAFLLLHVLGARYLYSYVPYDDWLQTLLGFRLDERFGFRRNHYDRLVHFAFGALWVPPVREVLARRFDLRGRLGRYFAVEFVLAASLLYELFEWGLTMVLSPEDAGAYNGEQGDRWDAQKDMACALLGATLAAILGRSLNPPPAPPARRAWSRSDRVGLRPPPSEPAPRRGEAPPDSPAGAIRDERKTRGSREGVSDMSGPAGHA